MQTPEIKKYLGFEHKIKEEELNQNEPIFIAYCKAENLDYGEDLSSFRSKDFRIFIEGNDVSAKELASDLYHKLTNKNAPELKEFISLEAVVGINHGFGLAVSSAFANFCKKYNNKIYFLNSNNFVSDASWTLYVMTLCVTQNSSIKVFVEGIDDSAEKTLLRLYEGITSRDRDELYTKLFDEVKIGDKIKWSLSKKIRK